MTPEGVAWQVLKGRMPDRTRDDRLKVTGLAGYGNQQRYADVGPGTRMSRTGQRQAERRMVFDETERAKQKPVDSEFDSQEDEEQQDMTADRAGLGTGAEKVQQQREAMRMLGQNLAQQRQPGM